MSCYICPLVDSLSTCSFICLSEVLHLSNRMKALPALKFCCIEGLRHHLQKQKVLFISPTRYAALPPSRVRVRVMLRVGGKLKRHNNTLSPRLHTNERKKAIFWV